MTRKEISDLIATFGPPTALDHFPPDRVKRLTPPYITFNFDGSDDFIADNTNYYRVDGLTIDLYTETRDFTLMDSIGAALNAAGLVYRRVDTWIEAEKLYQIEYLTEVQIDGKQS